MKVRLLFTLLYCCFIALSGAFSQTGETWPRLERSYMNHFYRENDSYSKKCFDDIFPDRQGRLWLVPCGDERLINSIGLFRFDGYSFQPVEVLSPEGTVIEAPLVTGFDDQGRFIGTTEEREFFRMGLDTHESNIILPVDSSFSNFQAICISSGSDEAFALGKSENSPPLLFRLEEDGLVQEPAFHYPQREEMPEMYGMTISPESIWLLNFSLPIYRFDRQKKTLDTYGEQDFTVLRKIEAEDRRTLDGRFMPKLLVSSASNVYLLFKAVYDNQLFGLDREKEKFVPITDQFPADWLSVDIFRDQAGNICFLFQDANAAYRAVLETVDGQRFDYSSVVAGQQDIRSLAGQDFRRQLFLLTGTGLYCAGIREEGLIQQTLTDKWGSSMADLPDGRLLINTVQDGWFVYDKITGKTMPFQGPDCGTERPAFGDGMKQQIIPDKDGKLWFISRSYLVRYDPATNDCESFNFGKRGALFAFAREGLAVYQHSRNQISFMDVRTQQAVAFGDGVQQQFEGFVRDILVDQQGLVWIPTNNGLWKIDIDRGESEVLGLENGFTDSRFTSIFEDAGGRLWLGTYFGGLQVYDPRTGTINIIDQEQGLSNNTVMSIIADDEGDMWVGTEYGINLVSKAGEVLNSFHQEDGLTYEIFERFDPFKSMDGRLYFGTRQGISNC
ncbi:ligand-binding sensor domain-containing protein [Flavilitoribacter nigricans]|uniref:Two component regulator propeller n=1 Tax=Flavilitoribacter nigricans (strain ATCC 23147 / DSM 23189 / NBRC 102662 / NCIMB 1420 / SS-2) TaxID=1122177 RepID=A0A2D0NE76_FLAN2|nr:two-component regulator propeller domain-containing protein [Flavilitoribacter nigricans]PHN06676.1 hypothetical protein CRP01_10290 [Flavilitoribacter nigricans DSM 23189 = NBRC 102662]